MQNISRKPDIYSKFESRGNFDIFPSAKSPSQKMCEIQILADRFFRRPQELSNFDNSDLESGANSFFRSSTQSWNECSQVWAKTFRRQRVYKGAQECAATQRCQFGKEFKIARKINSIHFLPNKLDKDSNSDEIPELKS